MAALEILSNLEPAETKKLRKSNLTSPVKQVAKKLGNTAAVCKKNYIYPDLLELYKLGELEEVLHEIRDTNSKSTELSPQEQFALEFLKIRIPKDLEEV